MTRTRSWRCPAHRLDHARSALARHVVVIDSGSSGVLRPFAPDVEGTGRFTYDGELLTVTSSFADPLASEIWRALDDLCGPPVGTG